MGLGLAGCLVAAGCGRDGGGSEGGGEGAAADPDVVVDSAQVQVAWYSDTSPEYLYDLRALAQFDPEASYLEGPHHRVPLSFLADAGTHEVAPDDPALLAEAPGEGEQTLVVALDWRSGRWSDEAEVTAEVLVGDHPFPVTAGPTGGPRERATNDMLVVQAPEGAPLALRVTDSGRAQTIDLRRGTLGDDAAYELASAPIRGEFALPATVSHPELGEESGDVSVTAFESAHAALEPYVPGRGWAPAGRRWLTVTGVDIYTTLATNFLVHPAETYSLTLPDGSTVAALSDHLTVGNGGVVDTSDGTWDPDLDGDYVVFDVPETLTDATLTVTPRGTMTDLGIDAVGAETGFTDVPIEWVTPPGPAEFPLHLTPDGAGA